MVPVDPDFLRGQRHARRFTVMVAEDPSSGALAGVVTGVDHRYAFDDPEDGSSLWCLAVDPQAPHPGIGEALVRSLAEHYQARGRAYLDLSVMHDNAPAIALYEKLGFERMAVFCVKRKNPINEKLFIGRRPDTRLNPYARIIVDEARRRGIGVDVVDAEGGYFTLSNGGRAITCRESLSELTTAVAMSRCDDKAVTRRLLDRAGLRLPEQAEAGDAAANAAFLARHGRVVVKPARGEQGAGVAVDLTSEREVEEAVERARRLCGRALIEELVEGEDLRLIVIGYELVAAAVRRPAAIVGDGRGTVADLIEALSRRRAAATGGESRVPIDRETERCLAAAGFGYDSVLPEGQVLPVRRTANLHTGGTIHDVTADLHPALGEAAVAAARALDIPVVGLDFIVPRVDGPDYAVIEANERPGLANHEPQPTAERFVDLLFPETAGRWPA
jgi:GNAT-family acetyltransferase (TIGR03103 family)